MKKITAALIGAGARGMTIYGPYALNHTEEIQFVAIAEPDRERREKFREIHGISEDMCFEKWQDMLEKPKLADAILVCTQDRMHFEPAVKALESGYHVMLEKPMSNDAKECVVMGEYAKKYQRIFVICHVLRYTSYFSALKKLVDSGRIGKLISIVHNENVEFWHQAHSYVRGNWRNTKESSPMILAKCCHDMDILQWLADSNCKRISSFGSLTHFKSSQAPEGAPKRCLDGCPAEKDCPYYAPKQYLTDNIGWPTSVISNDTSMEARIKALKEGPYGRCVYHCDNDVVDHQVVNIEFENEVTVAFTMCAFTGNWGRTTVLMGTKGGIRASDSNNKIEISDFISGEVETIHLEMSEYGHGGGDYGIMHDFVKLVAGGDIGNSLTSAELSVQSHLMAFAAEKSRLEGKVIDINEFKEELKNY